MTSEFRRGLALKLFNEQAKISAWMQERSKIAPTPFYSSVDLRDSGDKIAPVDCNLFPAGFNNICSDDLAAAPPLLRAKVNEVAESAGLNAVRKIALIPESHTSNTFYIENLAYLSDLLSDSGFEVRISWYEEGEGAIELESASGRKLRAERFSVSGGRMRVGTDGFDPDIVLLNNDFSSGYPHRLDGVKQPIAPSPTLGWHTRKKSTHFVHYNRLATEFCKHLGLDPFLFTVDTELVSGVNFNEDQGLDQVRTQVSAMMERLRAQYKERGITREPFVFIKNNAGTYGMGIMTVHSLDEIDKMNRRTKNKMSVGKNRSQITEVVIQEGIPTTLKAERRPAEPVIYLAGCELLGGFLRSNSEKGSEDNLNSTGMMLRKLCVSDLARILAQDDPGSEERHLELIYGTVARLSALAAGLEAKPN
jgi:glutamate--cysteine ligase